MVALFHHALQHAHNQLWTTHCESCLMTSGCIEQKSMLRTYCSLSTSPNQGGNLFQYPAPKNGVGTAILFHAQECMGTGNKRNALCTRALTVAMCTSQSSSVAQQTVPRLYNL